MKIEDIAKACHEVNRAFCAAIGDTSQTAWEDAPDWQKTSAINGVRFHLAGLLNGKRPDPRDSHRNWMQEKLAAGWVLGPVKDAEAKTHPCLVDYFDLPREQQVKDTLFVETFLALAPKLDLSLL